MKKFDKKSKLSLIIFSVIAFLLSYCIYHGLFHTFYQQDEWMSIGSFFVNGWRGTLEGQSVIHLLTALGRPLVIPIHYIFYHTFLFQIWPLASFSIVMHALNTILVYMITYVLLGSILGAWCAGLFFLISYNGSQAVSWFATSTVTLSSVFFSLLAILLFFLYLKDKKTRYIVFSEISVIISYLFKESAIALIVLLPCMYVLFTKKRKSFIKTVKIFLPLFCYFSYSFAVTIWRLLHVTKQWGVFVGQSNGGMVKILYNSLLYPILSFSQIFIPFPLITKISPALRSITIFSNVFFVGLSLVMLCFLAIFTAKSTKKWKEILFVIIFIFSSFVPYAILQRGASYLDSRYFYFGMAGGGILIGILIGSIGNYFITHRKKGLLLLCLFLFGYTVYLFKNIQFIERDINSQIIIANERISVLQQIKQQVPVLPKNPIFYVTGDIGGYYGLPQLKIPFQQGIGYTLMCLYYPAGSISQDLLKLEGNFFWDVYGQGYKEIEGKGFGYFWNKDDLLLLFKTNKNLSVDQIVGIYYYSSDRRIENISPQIHEYILENR